MNIERKRNIFPDSITAKYNLTAWPMTSNHSVALIGREVTKPGGLGEPDNGVLKYFETSPDGSISNERVVWKPSRDNIHLEDPRALPVSGEKLIIGLTAVIQSQDDSPTPYPAIVTIGAHNSWKDELPPITIVNNFGPGKNVTPIDQTTFLFRPDDPAYNHKILAFSTNEGTPVKIGDIEFPTDLFWAKWRIGTTISPIWLNDDEALFIIHGITIQVIGGVEKYVYSLGRAKLTRLGTNFLVTVAPEPILTPDHFLDGSGRPLVEELHPELRRVVYSCGGILRKDQQDILSLYVNVGDKTTFEVDFSLAALKEDLF